MKTETKRKAIMKKEVKKDVKTKKVYEEMYKSQVKLCNVLSAELAEQGLDLKFAQDDAQYFKNAFHEKCDDLFKAEAESNDKPGWVAFWLAFMLGGGFYYVFFVM